MRPLRSARLPLLAAAVWLTGVAALRAQQPASPMTMVPRTNAVIAAEPGTTVSAVFFVKNPGAQAIKVSPRITTPMDWSVVTGGRVFSLGGGESDTWVVSMSVPAHAARGQYVIPVAASLYPDGAMLARDSVVVEVKERRAVDVVLLDHPAYVIAGSPYTVSFLVRNSGNGPARLQLSAHSARDGVVTMDAGVVTLSADSTRTVNVQVGTRKAGMETGEDVLEMHALDSADSAAEVVASARITIVPKPGSSEGFVTVPAQLALRAAGPGTGVAPFELVGGGRVRGNDQLDFTFRGPTGPASPFGEREEYRVGLRSDNYRVHVGDDFYGFSQLTQVGQEGFGGGGEMSLGPLAAGGYSERFRFQPGNIGETGASLALRPAGFASTSQLSVVAVDRTGGVLAGQILSSNLSVQPLGLTRLDAEYAASNGTDGPGSAATVRLSGSAPLQYDLSHLVGSNDFAGAARASRHDYATLSTQPWHDLQLFGAASSHESTSPLAPYQLRTASIGLSRADGLSISYVIADQHASAAALTDSTLLSVTPADPAQNVAAVAVPSNTATPGTITEASNDGTQRGLVLRGQHAFGFGRIWAGSELGTMHLTATGADRQYHEAEFGTSVDMGRNTVSAFAELYDGGSITRGPAPMTLIGGNANIQLAAATKFTIIGTGALGRAGTNGFSQIDARLTQALRTGASVSLRTRITTGQLDPRANQRLVFAEYSLPLRVPVGAIQAPGRVRGRIVNGETGLGVSGALVRLGAQTAITDGDGRVSFAGLPAGQYRVSLAQDMSMASSAIDGDPTVRVDSTRREPATFQLAVARAASVQGTVHHWVFAKTAIGDEPDSLVDAGPMRGVVVALTSGRDTLYRTTDNTGGFRFNELPPKHWTLKVLTAAPARSRYEPDELEIDLQPGKAAQANLRLLPVRREVHMLDQSDTPLVLPDRAPPPGQAQPPRGSQKLR